MSKVQTLVQLLLQDRGGIAAAAMQNFSRSSLSHLLSDRAYVSLYYRSIFKRSPDLANPKTFNEKLQWLKLYARDPKQNVLVDKAAVKGYIADTLGAEYVIPTLGVWERYEDIDFDALPKRFVLKCTHDSGSVVLCRDKDSFDFDAAAKKLKNGLSHNLYWHGREWVYKDVKPRILAEAYMTDSAASDELRDYKFFCFDGKVKCFKVDFDRFVGHRANYYAPDCSLLPFGEVVCPPDFDRRLELPASLPSMIRLAERLSAGYPFLRVDFYDVGGRIYFGELTFFPASGFGPFVPDSWDETLGSWITLPEKGGERR